MSLVLDAGALVAIERRDREVIARLERERREGRIPRTHGAVVGQVWRGGRGRQAELARALGGIHVVPIDDDLGRRAGVLLGKARQADVVDAALVLIAEDGDRILTADPDDLQALAEAADLFVELVAV